MKLIGILNGWQVAPWCWRQFLLRPLRIEQTPAWTSVQILGVVLFFERKAP